MSGKVYHFKRYVLTFRGLTRTDETANRLIDGTSYVNDKPYPIFVVVTSKNQLVASNSYAAFLNIGGSGRDEFNDAASAVVNGSRGVVQGWVMPGQTYSVTGSVANKHSWIEWK